MLRSMNLDTTIPVGNSDAGSYFNNHVLAAIDYGVSLSYVLSTINSPQCLAQLANVHPWFANVSIQQSAEWTTSFFESVDVAAADAQSNKPKMYIAETGWPSVSDAFGLRSLDTRCLYAFLMIEILRRRSRVQRTL
jgi:hypothetical protein